MSCHVTSSESDRHHEPPIREHLLPHAEPDMIHETSGDILLTKSPAIAHGVAPNDHFDHGLALALRERWPSMARDFRHYAHQTHPKPGELWRWSGVGGVRIFNLLTQEGEHGRGKRPGPASLKNVSHCLRRLRHELEDLKLPSLAMPKLATGVGGLEWEPVRELIEQHLGDLPTHVYLYTTYRADQQANEPHATDSPSTTGTRG